PLNKTRAHSDYAGTGCALALLWHFLLKPLPVAYPFSAVRTPLWGWSGEQRENDAAYRGQSWLGWRAGDSFFSALPLRDGGAAGKRRRSSSSAHGGEALANIDPEVVKADLLFELLVRLLADPARLDGGSQSAQISLRR